MLQLSIIFQKIIGTEMYASFDPKSYFLIVKTEGNLTYRNKLAIIKKG